MRLKESANLGLSAAINDFHTMSLSVGEARRLIFSEYNFCITSEVAVTSLGLLQESLTNAPNE